MTRPNAVTSGDWAPDVDDPTSVDDLAVRGADVVHVERMSSTYYWIGITVGDKTIHIDVTSRRKIKARVRQ